MLYDRTLLAQIPDFVTQMPIGIQSMGINLLSHLQSEVTRQPSF